MNIFSKMYRARRTVLISTKISNSGSLADTKFSSQSTNCMASQQLCAINSTATFKPFASNSISRWVIIRALHLWSNLATFGLVEPTCLLSTCLSVYTRWIPRITTPKTGASHRHGILVGRPAILGRKQCKFIPRSYEATQQNVRNHLHSMYSSIRLSAQAKIQLDFGWEGHSTRACERNG